MKNLTMMNPKNLDSVINTYFALKKKEAEPYTLPGLALACGFSKTGEVLGTLQEAEEDQSTYPLESIRLLTRAVTLIEDHCITNGLKGKFSAPLAKFCLGAYHNVRDTNEQANQSVTQLAIVFSDGLPKITDTSNNRQFTIQNNAPDPTQMQYLPRMGNAFDSEVDALIAQL